MNEVVERVAKVIAKYIYGSEGLSRDNWKDCVELTKEAITAMREPTDKMIDNVGKVVVNKDGFPKSLVMGYDIKRAYQAMIDEALKD